MAIYAIGDLHLPGHGQKPMNIFGSHWEGHFETISTNWIRDIKPTDIVLIPGDISWAMQLEQAADDLAAIAALPGRKLILRGNHDYWWSSLQKVREALDPSIYALQNDALRIENHVFCGTRGWLFPTQQQTLTAQDEKIYQRELLRLRMSLTQAKEIASGDDITVLMHFPPLFADGRSTAFTELLEEFSVRRVVYGHLHGSGIKIAFEGEREGINYCLTSCDALNFCPLCIVKDESQF
ncbi:MAG: metallophosphoesterase [Clostridia bacterium]